MACARETLIPHRGNNKMETKLGQIAEYISTDSESLT